MNLNETFWLKTQFFQYFVYLEKNKDRADSIIDIIVLL